MEERYPILQSGFVSMTENGLSRPKPVSPVLRNDILLKEYRVPANKYFYSEKVDDIYRRWMADHSILNNFEFREEVLREFKALIGIESFGRWVEFQSKKPTLGNTHVGFINSTLEYLFTRQPRAVSIQQWVNLVDVDTTQVIVEVDDDAYFSAKDSMSDARLPSNINRILEIWTGIEGGFEDLVTTLYVIFGQRAMKNNAVSQM